MILKNTLGFDDRKVNGIQRSRWVSPWLQWGLLEQPRLTDQVVTISEVGGEEEHGGQHFGMHVDNVDLRCVVGGWYWEEYTDLFKLSLIGWLDDISN